MTSKSPLSAEEIQLHNNLFDRAFGLLKDLAIFDGRPHKVPGLLERQTLREAARLFQQVIELNPSNYQAMLFLGKAFQSLGELDSALTWFLRAHEFVPTNPAIAKEAGYAAGRLGRHEIAIQVMTSAGKEHPNDPALCLNLGLSYLMSGRPAEANEAFARAVELEPARDMNRRLRDLARDVVAGKHACPKTEAEISATMQAAGTQTLESTSPAQRHQQEIPPVDCWSVAQGQNNGRPMFLRINTGLRSIAGKAPFDHRFGVAISFRSPNENGLPTKEESEDLNRIEEQLLQTFSSSRRTLLALVITTSGFREFVFYTSVPRDIAPAMEQFRRLVTSHNLQFYVKLDREWSVFTTFAK